MTTSTRTGTTRTIERPPSDTTIKTLFRPSTLHQDSLHRVVRARFLSDGFTEVELLPGLTLQHVLATGITWEDLCRFLCGNKLVWIASSVYLCSHVSGDIADITYTRAIVIETPNNSSTALRVPLSVYICSQNSDSRDAPLICNKICAFLLRLLATSEKRSVRIKRRCYKRSRNAVSGPTLTRFFQESRDNLCKVTLENLILNKYRCRALATVSRPTLAIILKHCGLADHADCRNVFVECLQSDRGPTKLIQCEIDSHILAKALTGNTRVIKLRPSLCNWRDDAGMSVLLRALSDNRGLEELNLRYHSISDENWMLLCRSLTAHPAVHKLDLRSTSPRRHPSARRILTDDEKAYRTRAIADILLLEHTNTILHTIRLSKGETDQRIYAETIHPRLETNRNTNLSVNKHTRRPRVPAIK
jgi:hypothetical protein